MTRKLIPGGTLEQRWQDGLRMLGLRSSDADALARADALWLARVLPPLTASASSEPPGSESVPGASPPPTPPSPPPGGQANPAEEAQAASASTASSHSVALAETRAMYVMGQGQGGEPTLNARRVQLPAAQALPGRSDLERALRPFLRRRDSTARQMLDAEATAQASAQASAERIASLRIGRGQSVSIPHALIPRFRPVRERWFDVALLVEDDDTMRVFDDTVLEFHHLLAHHGAFGTVRLWRWSVQGQEVQVRTASGQPSGPRAMLETHRPRLVLILTHGASPHWHQEPLRRFARMLASSAVAAFVQMLPPRAWSHTALGPGRQKVRTRTRAALNRHLDALDRKSGAFKRNQGTVDAVPVLSLDVDRVGEWANWVMSSSWAEHEAVSMKALRAVKAVDANIAINAINAVPVPTEPRADSAPMSPTIAEAAQARDRVLRFRGMASAQAFALIRLMATTVVTVPVMRLMLQSLPAPHLSSSMAEVLMSGLLARRSPPGTPVAERVFEFLPGVREWLHGGLTGGERSLSEAAGQASRETIRQFVEYKTGRTLRTFEALFEDPEGVALLPASAQAFVEVSAKLHALSHPRGRGKALRPVPVPPEVELGLLHGFPPVTVDLVARPAIVGRLRARIAALAPGERLTLLARTESGARSLLATLLAETAVRARFTGGVWFDEVPPPRRGVAGGPRLSFRPVEQREVAGPDGARISTPDRGRDVEIRLRWTSRNIEVDIGWLEEDEASAHLVAMGLRADLIPAARSLHRGQPALVPLVGEGFRVFESWPRLPEDPVQRLEALARFIVDRLPSKDRADIELLAALRPGYPSRWADESVARRLGWLCPGVTPEASGTLNPSVIQRLFGKRSGALRVAHGEILDGLLGSMDRLPAVAAYASANLLGHALECRDRIDVIRLLFDRSVMARLIQGDLLAFRASVERRAKGFPELGRLLRRLNAPVEAGPLHDHARSAFAPTGSYAAWPSANERAAGIDGQGIRVAIVATGVDVSHPELQHLRFDGADRDADGHGTSVASLIAGRFIGIAPGVALRSLAAMGSHGRGETDSVVGAFDRLLALPAEERPDIVCLPFGSSLSSEIMTLQLRRMAEEGMLLIGAAGNDGRDAPGFPASLEEVVSVGALTLGGRRHSYSNANADLMALGDALVATPMSATGASVTIGLEDGVLPAPYSRETGTSFACAAVAGLAALYAQVSGLRGQALRELMLYASGGRGSRASWNPRAVREILGGNAIDSVSIEVAEVRDEAHDDAPVPEEIFMVLWVDDRPQNNAHERQMLAPHGAVFQLASSTDEALRWLKGRRVDLIISDMGRPKDARAGYTLLKRLREAGDDTPYIIYSGSRAALQREEAIRLGATGCVNLPDELVTLVLEIVDRRGRDAPMPA